MGVVGHHHSSVQLISKRIIATNRFEYDVARPFRQQPAISGNKCDEVAFTISLQMRQIAPVESHRTSLAKVSDNHKPRRGGRIRPPRRALARQSTLELAQ